jgi:hypothetical protein
VAGVRAPFFERSLAWLSGLIAAIGYLSLSRWISIPTGVHDLFSAAVNIAAIGVGFLLTANSILVSADEKWIVQRAKEAGAYQLLVGYLLGATRWCLAAAILSAVAMLYDPKWDLRWYPVALSVWIYIAIGAAAALVRVLNIFAQVLLALGEEDRG